VYHRINGFRTVPRDWNQHYSDPAKVDETPDALLVEVIAALQPGRALDLACGAGRNALYLARLGWQVTAVDGSGVAIRKLRERAAGLSVDALVADLEAGEFDIVAEGYDLICDFFYLQRDLFPRIREGVKLGGVFAAAIHLADQNATTGPRNPAFVLNPGELREEFAGWKILFYSETAETGRRAAARIIARKA
jgi:tellurite methyltransferase